MTPSPRIRADPYTQGLVFGRGVGLAQNIVFSGKSTRRNGESTKFRTAQGPKAGALNTALEQ